MTAMERRLIDNPDNQPSTQRRVFGVLTGIAWIVYAYLWLPLITAVVWFLGVKSAYLELYLRNHRIDSFLVLVIPLIVLVVSVVFLGWAEYNRIRYQDKVDRRGVASDVSMDEVAHSIGATPLLARQLQESRHSRVGMCDGVVTLMPAAPSPRAA